MTTLKERADAIEAMAAEALWQNYVRWAIPPLMSREQWDRRLAVIAEQSAAGTLPTDVYKWGYTPEMLAGIKAESALIADLTGGSWRACAMCGNHAKIHSSMTICRVCDGE